MNYMPELNAFAERMRRNPLPNNAQLLWYKLMDTANRLHWPETFQLDNARIMQMMNVGSRHTAAAARQELVDDGLLEFIAGAKGKPSVYKMLSVAALEGAAERPEEESQEAPDSFLWDVKDDITTYFGYTEALGQELQQIALTLWEEFFPRQQPNQNDVRQVFHRIRVQEKHEDGSWTMSFPQEKKQILAHAFDIAREQGKLNWGYVNGIYQVWSRNGYKTLSEIEESEYRREDRKNGHWSGDHEKA